MLRVWRPLCSSVGYRAIANRLLTAVISLVGNLWLVFEVGKVFDIAVGSFARFRLFFGYLKALTRRRLSEILWDGAIRRTTLTHIDPGFFSGSDCRLRHSGRIPRTWLIVDHIFKDARIVHILLISPGWSRCKANSPDRTARRPIRFETISSHRLRLDFPRLWRH